MLSKEEIENKINLKDKTKYTIRKSKEIIENHKEDNCDCSIETSLAYDMQYVERYIEQLESNKQKLIEKLEEDNKKAKQGFETTLSSYEHGIMNYTQEILEIVKGEKE